MKHSRQNLNGAAIEIAKALNGAIGIRRTYGGRDDSNRMHISWQILRGLNVIGMIDLYCEDGYGRDGMQWGAKVIITGPGVDFNQYLFGPWAGYTGRTAKRIARKQFFTTVEKIIANMLNNKRDTVFHSPMTVERPRSSKQLF